jgi:hypothetical protein
MEQLTLQDIRQGLDPDGLVAKVVDVMSTSGHLTEDAVWAPTNAFGKNVTAKTAFEPEGDFRRANRGVAPGKGGLSQDEDFVGYLEAMSLVDDKVIRSVGKGQKQAARMQYDALFAKGLAKQGRRYTLYGDRTTDPDQFNGMSAKRDAIGDYCFDAAPAAPSGNRTSFYITAWNTDSGCSMLYPNETQAGIQTEDFGKQIITDPNDSARFLPAWITWFYHDLGFMVKDDRALIRIANVEADSSVWDVTYMKKIMSLVNEALRSMNFSVDDGNIRLYSNKDGLLLFDNMVHELSSFHLTDVVLENKTFLNSYRGLPLRECNEILSDEGLVS